MSINLVAKHALLESLDPAFEKTVGFTKIPFRPLLCYENSYIASYISGHANWVTVQLTPVLAFLLYLFKLLFLIFYFIWQETSHLNIAPAKSWPHLIYKPQSLCWLVSGKIKNKGNKTEDKIQVSLAFTAASFLK